MDLESLPLVILQRISEHVADSELNRSSLWSFAAASRACYAATCRERFSRVVLKVDLATDHGEQFQRDLLRFESLIESLGSKRYVRNLRICNGKANEESEEDDIVGHVNGLSFSVPPVINYAGSTLNSCSPDAVAIRKTSWEKLARFLSGLKLQDLIWELQEQVPTCILSTLHDNNPTCRLHVRTFVLRSLYQINAQRNMVDSEYLLATSPCLYSVVGPCPTLDFPSRVDYNQEAMRQMAAGLAPNLRHVHLYREGSPHEMLFHWYPPEKLPWQRFYSKLDDESFVQTKRECHLESLVLEGIGPYENRQILKWEERTYFPYLHTLKVSTWLTLEVVKMLAGLAEDGSLACLQSLDLPFWSSTPYGDDEMNSNMERLLGALQPLESLAAERIGTGPLNVVLEHHGPHLGTLELKDTLLNNSHVFRLQTACNKIKRLRIDILRSGGSEQEVQIYRMLGSMLRLERLVLCLRCTNDRYAYEIDDMFLRHGRLEGDELKKAKAAAMRQVLINIAVDEALARSIFDTMLAANQLVHDTLPARLSYIRLKVPMVYALEGQVMQSAFSDVLRWIGRQWMCQRDPRDTHHDQIVIKELDEQKRQEIGSELNMKIENMYGSEEFMDIWRAIWPDTGKSLKDDWQSFPLSQIK